MESKITKKDSHWVISYEGDTSGILPGPLPEVMQALRDGAQEIVLNFEGLRFLNPNGIKAIKESLEVARKRAANIGIAGPQPQVRRALKLSGLAPHIPVYYNEHSAIADLDTVDYYMEAVKEGTDRLLICQNKTPITSMLRNAFRKHPLKPHYRLMPCRNLKQAAETLLEERVDCILIDATYPLFEVTEFIEYVETDECLPDIPMLIVTSESKLSQAELMVRNGAHEILRLPIIPTEAVVRIQTLISHMKDHRPFIPPEKVQQPRGWKA